MLAASNRSGGQNVGFPDVCNTPVGSATVPLPYPNVAAHAQATGFATTVKIENMNALILTSIIPQTTGDEAGTAHSTFMDQGQFTTGSAIVYIEKQPGIHLTNVTTGNSMNQSGGAVVVSGSTTVFYTLATPGVGRVGEAEAIALRDAVRGSDDVVTGVMRDETTGLVRIARFTSDVATRVDREIRKLAGRGMRALVLDLRDNPGGELDAAARLAEDFLPEGAVIAVVTDADGDETVLRARRGAGHGMPLLLLVDGGTASAAELFAGALKAHGRASIAGQGTYGKVSVQRPVALGDGGVVHATVATWRTTARV